MNICRLKKKKTHKSFSGFNKKKLDIKLIKMYRKSNLNDLRRDLNSNLFMAMLRKCAMLNRSRKRDNNLNLLPANIIITIDFIMPLKLW